MHTQRHWRATMLATWTTNGTSRWLGMNSAHGEVTESRPIRSSDRGPGSQSRGEPGDGREQAIAASPAGHHDGQSRAEDRRPRQTLPIMGGPLAAHGIPIEADRDLGDYYVPKDGEPEAAPPQALGRDWTQGGA